MNPETDTEFPPPADHASMERSADMPSPSNWLEALLNLVTSRIALIQLESKEAARQAAQRVLRIVAAAICAFFTWALLVAGGVSAISAATSWPWHWVAIAAAFAHMLVAILLVKTAKSSSEPPFPITRSEFQKDRAWIENFKKNPK